MIFQEADFVQAAQHPCLAPAGHRGRVEAAQASPSQSAGRASDDHDRRPGPIRCCYGSAGSEASASTRAASGAQSGGEFPPPDPTTRATAAAVQIPGLSPEIPHYPSDLEHLQQPAPSDQQTHTSPLPRRRGHRVGGRRRLIESPGRGSQPTEVSLTAPAGRGRGEGRFRPGRLKLSVPDRLSSNSRAGHFAAHNSRKTLRKLEKSLLTQVKRRGPAH